MGIITTGSHPKELWPGIVAFFGETYKEHPEEFSQIFDRVSSDKMYEERVANTGLGLAGVKTQGASVTFDSTKQDYVARLTNVVYAIGAIITREAIEDGQYESKATRLARCMAFSIRQTQENVGANVLNRAFNPSYTGGDGKELLATDHPLGGSGGTFSNMLSVAADLSESSLEDLLIQIMQAVDSQGLKISLMGQKLIIHPNEYFNAHRIMESVLQNDTANNATNVIKANGLLPGGITVNHYLTDTDAFFIKTNIPKETGLIHQVRRPYEFTQDNDFDNENAKMKSTIREAFGWVDPRSLFGSAGS